MRIFYYNLQNAFQKFIFKVKIVCMNLAGWRGQSTDNKQDNAL